MTKVSVGTLTSNCEIFFWIRDPCYFSQLHSMQLVAIAHDYREDWNLRVFFCKTLKSFEKTRICESTNRWRDNVTIARIRRIEDETELMKYAWILRVNYSASRKEGDSVRSSVFDFSGRFPFGSRRAEFEVSNETLVFQLTDRSLCEIKEAKCKK